jgi:chemotaxis protein methyltransferase CheR
MALDPGAYQFLTKYLLEQIGYEMGAGKEYLVEARLGPIAPLHGCAGANEMIFRLRDKPDPQIRQTIIDSMVTNESLFFRDDLPFQYLRNHALPELVRARAGTRTLKIWSAACSTGQEPYSIAMTLKEESVRLGLAGWRIDILGTDISTAALNRARAGVFSNFEIQRGLPEATRGQYFEQDPKGWRFKRELTYPVRFEQANLLDNPPQPGFFDLIFLRNVLIYFEAELKAKVLQRMHQALAPDGFLFLGAAECLLDPRTPFSRVEGVTSSIYRRKESKSALNVG